MSFYASQFNNKSSRYSSSNLYGSNLSTIYADGPPPLDDTLEEDDGEIVFRDKSPRKESPEPKFDNDKSGPVSGESDFNPWSKNDTKQKDVAADDFGDFSSFADFSSAFGGDTKSQNESSWFKNGDNDQSSVTNFNHNFPNHQGGISVSSRKNVEKTEGNTSKDDDFGCFSGGDDSDFDDFSAFKSNNENTTTKKTEENSSKDCQGSENSESKKTTKSDELFKNDKFIQGSDQFNHSLGQNAKKSNFGSDDDFDEFGSSEGAPTLNGQSMSPTNHSNTSSAQNVTSNTHSASKPTCFSDDDDDDFGDFSSSSFDDDSGGTTKSPDLIINSQQTNVSSPPKANELQNANISESSIQSDRGIESEHNSTESKDSNEPTQLPQYNESGKKLEKNWEDTSDKDNGFTKIDQSKENITMDDKNNDDEFGEFSTSGSGTSKTDKIKSTELSSNNIVDEDGEDFGELKVGSTPSLPNLQDGEIGAVTAPNEENDKNDNDDDDGFGDFGATSPPSATSPHCNSDNDDDFGDFGSGINKHSSQSNDVDEFGGFEVASSTSTEGKPKGDGDDFGNFGAAPATSKSDFHSSADTAPDDGDEFGDFGSVPATSKPDLSDAEAANDDDDDDFGDFGSVPVTNKSDHHSNAVAADDDDFGDFGSVPVTSKPDHHSNAVADDDDDFGDFGSASTTSKPDHHGNNDDDDFEDFGEASATSEQNKTDEFGQFDSAPSKSSDNNFTGFKSSDNTSQGFSDFSSIPQKSMPSSFSTTNVPQSFSNRDAQQGQPPKMSGSTIVIKPQQNTNPDRLGHAFKECFTNKDITIESNIIIQMIEREVQSEKSRAWQQLLTSEKDGSLRFDWVLSEHQVKMLEGLSMLPVKIQTSVSFKPKAQVPTPLFASSMGLLEPVKGVITPFHHMEEINPSQDPFGAPPEVGVQDLGFGKGSKKETSTLHTEAKDNTSDTISVSSSLDLDFLAPSATNGESTKTESRGLFEDDLLGLGMFNEPSPNPKTTNGKDQKNIFKFNKTTIPLATNEGNLSEQAKIVIKDFEDLSFMLSKVLMFPLKSKD